MKNTSFFLVFIVLLVSCKKDKRADKTSEYPGEYKTDIVINYYPNNNLTSIHLAFSMGESEFDMQYLQLPKDCYLKMNGIEIEPKMEKYQTYYSLDVAGKPTVTVEFNDYDGLVYLNSIVPPDTAYFINIPDTISIGQDLEFQVNAPSLDSNETTIICLNGCGDQADFYYSGENETILIGANALENNDSIQSITFLRSKILTNPSLPIGGGSVTYNYYAGKIIYVE